MNVWLSYGKYLPENLSDMTFYLGIVMGSLLAFLCFIGILLTTKIKHCIVTCPFGVLTFTIFAVYYVLGILCLAAGFYGAEAFSDYCSNQDLDYWAGFDLFDYVKEIDNTYLELNKQLMCTDICQCSPYDVKKFDGYTFAGKNFTGSNYNLKSCLSSTDYSYKWDTDVLNYLEDLEKTYQCSGLCKAQTLLLFTDFRSGPNYNSCYYSIARELERDMGNMGYVFLTCGTFVFCAWFCSFGLCFRDKDARALREQMKLKKYVLGEDSEIDNSTINQPGQQNNLDGPDNNGQTQNFDEQGEQFNRTSNPTYNTKNGGDNENLVKRLKNDKAKHQFNDIDKDPQDIQKPQKNKKSKSNRQFNFRQFATDNEDNNQDASQSYGMNQKTSTGYQQYNKSGYQNKYQSTNNQGEFSGQNQYQGNNNYGKYNNSTGFQQSTYKEGGYQSNKYPQQNQYQNQQYKNNNSGYKNQYQNKYNSNYQQNQSSIFDGDLQQQEHYQQEQNQSQDNSGGGYQRQVYQKMPAQKRSGSKPFYPKGYSISRSNMILTLDVKPAVFELKNFKNKVQDSLSYVPAKNGYICFHFTSIDDQENIIQSSKKTFVMTMGTVRSLLDIDPDFQYKRSKRFHPNRSGGEMTDVATDNESGYNTESSLDKEIFFSFMPQNQNTILNMKIAELENRQYQFTYFEVINEKDIQNTMLIDVTPGELKVIQILVRYAMPSLLGWNGAMDPKVCGLFFKNGQYDQQ
eukprot:403353169